MMNNVDKVNVIVFGVGLCTYWAIFLKSYLDREWTTCGVTWILTCTCLLFMAITVIGNYEDNMDA